MFESFLSVCSATVFVVRSGSERGLCLLRNARVFAPQLREGFSLLKAIAIRRMRRLAKLQFCHTNLLFRTTLLLTS